MSHGNPPLDPPGRSRRAALHEHTAGPIVNPPLDGARAPDGSHDGCDDHGNPPLDGEAELPAATTGVLDDPRLDTADVERWFEARLGSDTVPTTKPTAPTTRSKKAAAKKRPAKKRPTTKRPAKKAPAKSAAATRAAGTKRAGRKRS